MRYIRRFSLFVTILAVTFPFVVSAQDAPASVSHVVVDVPADQILHADNPINLDQVAQGCQPICEVGNEVIWYVNASNQIDEHAAFVITANGRQVIYTVPSGVSGILFRPGHQFHIVTLDDPNRTFDGVIGAILALGMDAPAGIRRETPAFGERTELCDSHNPQTCASDPYMPFEGMLIMTSSDPTFCVYQQADDNLLLMVFQQDATTWRIVVGPAESPLTCSRVWFFHTSNTSG